MQKAKRSGIFCLLALLIALAICCFVYQATKGLTVTGLHEPVVWGAYVVGFTFFIGLTAGVLIVLIMISGPDAVQAAEKFLLSVTALVGLVAAGAFIILDLGRIDRFYYLVIYPQVESPLFWDFIVVNLLAGITITFCFTTLRQMYLKVRLDSDALPLEKFICKVVTVKKNVSIGKALRATVRVLALLLVVGAYLVTTEVFTSLKARPQWHSSIFSLAFLSSAILCGLSVFGLVRIFFEQSTPLGKRTPRSFEQRVFLFLLVIDVIIMLVKYHVDKNNPLIQEVYSLFPFSLFIFLIIGNVIPILLILFSKANKPGLYRLVPILVLVGVLLKRAELIIPAYFRRWLPFAPEASYHPTFCEISIVIGVCSAAIAALMLAFYFARFVGRRVSAIQTLQ